MEPQSHMTANPAQPGRGKLIATSLKGVFQSLGIGALIATFAGAIVCYLIGTPDELVCYLSLFNEKPIPEKPIGGEEVRVLVSKHPGGLFTEFRQYFHNGTAYEILKGRSACSHLLAEFGFGAMG